MDIRNALVHAASCPNTWNSCNVHYALSSWSKAGTILFVILIVGVVALVRGTGGEK